MASEILIKIGTSSTVACTSMASLAVTTSSGAQTAKLDLGAGAALLAQQYIVRLGTAFSSAPAAGGPVEVYVGFSSASAAASGNVAGLAGADQGYTGYNSDADVAKRQLTFVGVLAASAHTSAQVADVGTFAPQDRWAQFVVCNRTTQALASTGHSITVTPLKDEAQ